jgi:hypothetical protein
MGQGERLRMATELNAEAVKMASVLGRSDDVTHASRLADLAVESARIAIDHAGLGVRRDTQETTHAHPACSARARHTARTLEHSPLVSPSLSDVVVFRACVRVMPLRACSPLG